jgi:S-formylglutathione hydrolase FrmB
MGVKAQLQTSQGGHSWTVWSSQLGSVMPGLEPPASA